MPDRSVRARRMVADQLAPRGITDALVLRAMETVPREEFVAPDQREDAYADHPLPIGAGQTISQPYVVAMMLQAAEIAPSDRVLEIGAGSGYAAAVASRIAARVCAVERIESLAGQAGRRLARLGYDNVEIRHDDGTRGWPGGGSFDVILVAAAGPDIPAPLLAQLAPGGRLVMPVGPIGAPQRLVRIRRTARGDQREYLDGVVFVPLIGAAGYAEDDGGTVTQ